MLAAGIGFAATIIIARYFGAADFGFLASMTSIWALLSPLLALGAGRLLLRARARAEPALAAWVLGRGALIVGALLLVVIALAGIAGPALYDRDAALFLLASVALVSLVLQDPAKAVFQARDDYMGLARWQLLPPSARLVAVGLAGLAGASFLGFMVLYALTETLVIAVALRYLWGYRREVPALPGSAVSLAPRRDFLRQGAPFALSGMLYTIYYQIDVLMLGLMTGLEQAGLYKAAFVFVAAAYLLPGTLFQHYLLARIFRWWEDGTDLAPRVRRGLLGCLAYGGVVAGLFALLAGPLLVMFYGEAYATAAPALRWLGIAVLCHTLAIGVGAFLVTEAGIRRKVRVQIVTAVLNVAGNLLLIPVLGIMGAVVATIVTEAVLMSGYALMLVRELRHQRGVNAGLFQRA